MSWVCLRSTVKLGPPRRPATRRKAGGWMMRQHVGGREWWCRRGTRHVGTGPGQPAANFKATGRIDFGDEGGERERARASQKASLCVRTFTVANLMLLKKPSSSSPLLCDYSLWYVTHLHRSEACVGGILIPKKLLPVDAVMVGDAEESSSRGASRGPRKEEHKEQPTTHENKAKIWKHMQLPQCFFRTALYWER